MSQTIEVLIPEGLKAGDVFHVTRGMRTAPVTVPAGYRGGQKMQAQVQLGPSKEEMEHIRKTIAGAGKG